MAAVTRRRGLVWTLVQRDLRVRYSRSLLGYVWTVLDPLLMASVYFVVFTYVFNAKPVADTPYFLYLLSGLLAWQWFTGSVTDTTKSLIQEARLVRSTNLPREVWVIRCVVAKGVEQEPRRARQRPRAGPPEVAVHVGLSSRPRTSAPAPRRTRAGTVTCPSRPSSATGPRPRSTSGPTRGPGVPA